MDATQVLKAGSGALTFEEFNQREFPHVYRAIWLIAGNEDDALEATQEAFGRAFSRWPRLRKQDWVTGWVITTAHNWLRRRGRKTMTPAAPEVASGPDAEAIDLRRALRQLPRRQREALVLFYKHDQPAAEGWPVVTYEDPEGPYFEPDDNEGPRHVVASGTVSYEGENVRWSYTLFEVNGRLCGELSLLDEDDMGSGGLDCGLERKQAEKDLISNNGDFTIGNPLVSLGGTVSERVARVDLEFPSGESHRLRIFDGPSRYGVHAFVVFLARIDEPGLIVARDGDGNVVGGEVVCGWPSGRASGEPMTDGPTITYRGVYYQVADYCVDAISGVDSMLTEQ